MTPETVRRVEDMLDDSPVVDVTETFLVWKALLDELKAKIDARFTLVRDPSTLDLETYGNPPDGPGGSIAAYTGPYVDWMVHSWLGNPTQGFANLHLTVWLGPHIRVPHLGIALLVWPQGWFYLDSLPRTQLVADGDYFDRYYAPLEDEWLKVRDEYAHLSWFTSRAGFIRTSLSPTAYCYSMPTTPEHIDLVSRLTHAHVDRWLGWVDRAPRVPDGERAELAARDLAMRRNIAERDPANVMGVRYFGQDTTDRLVRALWGGDRRLRRPGT
ncbi:oxidoreductase [Embleya scabrispora]|uniref:Oxidoreductase n=1 Tax=Embleya scabrispora TaxID=159449 RepID=A0A1T3NRY9_9ACTN|nr:oxidoreductase [Embleya scabrispora]OPC79667.1 oxidoreductase [Embleya scabrispora]